MSEELKILSQLEGRIQKLVELHQQAKLKIAELSDANQALTSQLAAEKQKLSKMESDMEDSRITKGIQQNETIGVLKNRVNDIIREIDNNLALINNKSKK